MRPLWVCTALALRGAVCARLVSAGSGRLHTAAFGDGAWPLGHAAGALKPTQHTPFDAPLPCGNDQHPSS